MENIIKALQILAAERGWQDVIDLYEGLITQQQFIDNWVDKTSKWYNEQLEESEYATGVFDNVWIASHKTSTESAMYAAVPYKTTGLSDDEMLLVTDALIISCRAVFMAIHTDFCPDVPNDLLDNLFVELIAPTI